MMLDEVIWQQFKQEIDDTSNPNDTIKLRVNTANLNVRTGSGTNYSVKRKLTSGEIVSKIGQDGLWYQIDADEWIHSSYVVVM